MKPLDLKDGSKLTIYYYDKYSKKVIQAEAEVCNNGLILHEYFSFNWEDVGLNEREAMECYLDNLQKQLDELKIEKENCEKIKTQKYPINPILSPEQFKARYKHLSEEDRLKDMSEFQLEVLNAAMRREKMYNYVMENQTKYKTGISHEKQN